MAEDRYLCLVRLDDLQKWNLASIDEHKPAFGMNAEFLLEIEPTPDGPQFKAVHRFSLWLSEVPNLPMGFLSVGGVLYGRQRRLDESQSDKEIPTTLQFLQDKYKLAQYQTQAVIFTEGWRIYLKIVLPEQLEGKLLN